MEVDKHCEPYLQSREVIKILQQENTLLHSKVFNCLRKFIKYFYSIIPLRHPSIPNDILLMCAQDAFATAERIFFLQVKRSRFKPDTDYCLSYFRVLFKRSYLELFKKEVSRKNLPDEYLAEDLLKGYNEGEKKLDNKNFQTLKVQAVLNELGEEDNKIYQLVYIEKLKRSEIAELLKIQAAAVSNKVYRFHQRFSEVWEKINYK